MDWSIDRSIDGIGQKNHANASGTDWTPPGFCFRTMYLLGFTSILLYTHIYTRILPIYNVTALLPRWIIPSCCLALNCKWAAHDEKLFCFAFINNKEWSFVQRLTRAQADRWNGRLNERRAERVSRGDVSRSVYGSGIITVYGFELVFFFLE